MPVMIIAFGRLYGTGIIKKSKVKSKKTKKCGSILNFDLFRFNLLTKRNPMITQFIQHRFIDRRNNRNM